MPIWTITGEAGKAIDESAHTLPQLQAAGAVMRFESLAPDTLSYSVTLDTVADAAVLLPDPGQRITLLRDGQRFFTGICVGPKVSFDGSNFVAQVSVVGPWWHLQQIFLSSEVEDQAGDVAERTAYVFPTGSPRTHLIALVARAMALGAPIAQGSIASAFAIPRLSLGNIAFSEAISEVMRWLADGIVYFDYSGAGEPALCMQRRPAAATVTLTPGLQLVPSIEIEPRIDLEVEELKVFFARRETVDGKRLAVWDSQTAGAATSGLPRRQPVIVSGPEKQDTILPQNFTDSVTVRSAPCLDGPQVLPAVFWRYDERLRASGAMPATTKVGIWSEPDFFAGFKFSLEGSGIDSRVTDSEGNPIPAGYTYYLTTGETRDWWTKDGIEFVQARITATISSTIDVLPTSDPPAAPMWYQLLGGQTYNYLRPGPVRRYAYWSTVSVSVPLVKALWPVDTLLIRAEDYAFINPPEDLAENLLATQNWLPWQGPVSYVTEEIPAGHHLGKALNIAGFLETTSNMRALIAAHEIELLTGQHTLTLGAPDRLAYRDLVNRFRQSGADNIEWLVDSVSGDPGENPPPDPELVIPTGPEDSILFNGDALAFSGDFLTFTP